MKTEASELPYFNMHQTWQVPIVAKNMVVFEHQPFTQLVSNTAKHPSYEIENESLLRYIEDINRRGVFGLAATMPSDETAAELVSKVNDRISEVGPLYALTSITYRDWTKRRSGSIGHLALFRGLHFDSHGRQAHTKISNLLEGKDGHIGRRKDYVKIIGKVLVPELLG